MTKAPSPWTNNSFDRQHYWAFIKGSGIRQAIYRQVHRVKPYKNEKLGGLCHTETSLIIMLTTPFLVDPNPSNRTQRPRGLGRVRGETAQPLILPHLERGSQLRPAKAQKKTGSIRNLHKSKPIQEELSSTKNTQQSRAKSPFTSEKLT